MADRSVVKTQTCQVRHLSLPLYTAVSLLAGRVKTCQDRFGLINIQIKKADLTGLSYYFSWIIRFKAKHLFMTLVEIIRTINDQLRAQLEKYHCERGPGL